MYCIMLGFGVCLRAVQLGKGRFRTAHYGDKTVICLTFPLVTDDDPLFTPMSHDDPLMDAAGVLG